MRTISGRLMKNNSEKWSHPASCIFAGSSGVGKTELALNLVRHQHFSSPIENVFYFGCIGNESANKLNWHKILKDVCVTYSEGLPGTSFFSRIPENSLVVIDDQFEDAVNSKEISRAYKVDRRHSKFSIILITQSLFEHGKYDKAIRNNCEIFCLFKNYGDITSHTEFSRRLGVKKYYEEWLQDAENVKHAYIVINNSSNIPDENLRMSTNLFGELKKFGEFPVYYCRS